LRTRPLLPFILCILPLLVGCVGETQMPTPVAPITTQDIAFATEVPISDLNTHVKLRLSSEFTKSLKTGSPFTLWVENQGKEQLVFPYDWGVRSFMYSGTTGKWVEVGNRNQYSPKTDIVLDRRGQGSDWQLPLDVWPDLPEGQQSVTVRVLITGRLGTTSNSATQLVGAYVDVTLPP
jgi:hypothetical protein